VTNGRFRIPLAASCKPAINANPNAYVEVIDGANSLGRAPIGAVPYAVEADHAVNATNAASAAYAADAGHASTADTATQAANAPIVSAWQSYTPVMETSAGVAVAAATSTGKYRRVGDSMEAIVITTFQAAPATGTSYYEWTLPPNLTIDATKELSPIAWSIVGGGIVQQGANNNVALATYARNTTSVAAIPNGGSIYYVNDTVPIAFGAGGSINLFFTVPIAGWDVTQ
jgi:hypothetical protein